MCYAVGPSSLSVFTYMYEYVSIHHKFLIYSSPPSPLANMLVFCVCESFSVL